MSWSARGLVVDAPPPVPWAASHAALPVVLALDGDLRIWCSARDAEGRSHIASGRLDHQFSATFDEGAAIGIGPLGAFDDRGVTSSCVVQHRGQLFQYFTGWSLGATVPFYLGIGCAVSDDGGATFRKVSASPVLGRTAVDPFLTASPSILVENGLWRMWYVSGTGWERVAEGVRHRYHIKYAESRDGVEWRPTGHVCVDHHDASETSIARPCVIRDGGTYRMWFCARGDAYRIGYAESSDGFGWERATDDDVPVPERGEWDREMQAYPFVFDHAGERHMLYNGNGFGATGIGHAVGATP